MILDRADYSEVQLCVEAYGAELERIEPHANTAMLARQLLGAAQQALPRPARADIPARRQTARSALAYRPLTKIKSNSAR